MIREALRELTFARRKGKFDYRDKVIVITGGAGGIGSTFARGAAHRGATLIVVDLDELRAKSVVKELPAAKPEHLAIRADLTDQEQIATVMERIQAHCGRIDVLVNNTGMTSTERFGERSLASMDREILVNTLSPLYVTRLALPLLRNSPDPRVISTVSLAGIFPQPETPIYCASKFALRGAMLSIAMDLRTEGITVGSVLPSATDTRMLHREAYPKPRESYLVRAVMAVPNSLFFLVPFFDGRGVRGHQTYLRRLIERGDVIEVDGRLELAG